MILNKKGKNESILTLDADDKTQHLIKHLKTMSIPKVSRKRHKNQQLQKSDPEKIQKQKQGYYLRKAAENQT